VITSVNANKDCGIIYSSGIVSSIGKVSPALLLSAGELPIDQRFGRNDVVSPLFFAAAWLARARWESVQQDWCWQRVRIVRDGGRALARQHHPLLLLVGIRFDVELEHGLDLVRVAPLLLRFEFGRLDLA
jgi:hypothetical protein